MCCALVLPAQDASKRVKASDYPAHTALANLEIGADYLVHSVPGERGFYFTRDFLVVEVGIFPATREGVTLSSRQFTLRINGKTVLYAESAGTVAASLKYPDWEQHPTMTAQAGPVIIGPPAVGRFPGDQRAGIPLPVPRQPDTHDQSGVDKPVDKPIEQAVANAALPEGSASKPVKGCLFFAYKGKTKSIRSLELIYDAGENGPKAKIPLV